MNGQSVYICDSVRTPIGRYGGALSTVRADDLAAHPIRQLLARNPSLEPAAIDDVFLGCANQAGEDNRNVARNASLLAGLPETTPGITLNRLCASGLDAVGSAARAIASGDIDLAIAGGVESMSRAPFVLGKSETAFSRNMEIYDTTIGWRFVNPLMKAQYDVDSMPETAENVAAEYAVSRDDQDAFALRSQQRAAAAQSAGRFAEEIAPLEISRRRAGPAVVEEDEHLRPDTTLQILSTLKTPFREHGSVTAGNSSGVNDGAAAMILASEAAARRHALTPVARVVAMAAAGVAPRLMGVGPVPAARKALSKAGLALHHMDVIELNEAFASQAIASLRELGLAEDAEHVNPNGGAIALGHPLGMTGARLAMTAARELQIRNARFALCTMCVGVGQGAALVIKKA